MEESPWSHWSRSPRSDFPTEKAVVSLEDLRALTPGEYARAWAVVPRVRALREWRAHAAWAGHLDAVALPAGHRVPDQTSNDYMDAFRLVAAGAYETINVLRYYTSFLTGYRLIQFRNNDRGPTVAPLPAPAEVRDQVAQNLEHERWLLDFYASLKALVPRPLLLDPPWMLGEVGWNV